MVVKHGDLYVMSTIPLIRILSVRVVLRNGAADIKFS